MSDFPGLVKSANEKSPGAIAALLLVAVASTLPATAFFRGLKEFADRELTVLLLRSFSQRAGKWTRTLVAPVAGAYGRITTVWNDAFYNFAFHESTSELALLNRVLVDNRRARFYSDAEWKGGVLHHMAACDVVVVDLTNDAGDGLAWEIGQARSRFPQARLVLIQDDRAEHVEIESGTTITYPRNGGFLRRLKFQIDFYKVMKGLRAGPTHEELIKAFAKKDDGELERAVVELRYAKALCSSGGGARATTILNDLRARSNDPSARWDALELIVAIRVMDGDLEEARKELKRFLAAESGRGKVRAAVADKAHRYLAGVEVLRGHPDAAGSILERLVPRLRDTKPRDASLWVSSATLLAELQEANGADSDRVYERYRALLDAATGALGRYHEETSILANKIGRLAWNKNDIRTYTMVHSDYLKWIKRAPASVLGVKQIGVREQLRRDDRARVWQAVKRTSVIWLPILAYFIWRRWS